jgi:hypothetical protein
MAIAVYFGLGWATWFSIKQRNIAIGVVAFWGCLVLIGIGSSYVKFPRYSLIGMPTLLALAAVALLGDCFFQRLHRLRP